MGVKRPETRIPDRRRHTARRRGQLHQRLSRASTDYGHVAIVEEIKDNGSIVISESGGGIPYAWLRTLTKEQANNPNITYIH